MSKPQGSEITLILQDWNNGSEDAKEKLLPYVYDELKTPGSYPDGRRKVKPYAPADSSGTRSLLEIVRTIGN